jgi:hypothetical protein
MWLFKLFNEDGMCTEIIKINKQIVSKASTQIVSSSIGGALLRVRQDFYGLGLSALNMSQLFDILWGYSAWKYYP